MVIKNSEKIKFRKNAGITIVEAVIALVTAGIIAGVVGPLIIQAVDSWSFSIQQSANNDQHRNALATFVTDVEAASAVTATGSSSLQLTVNGSTVAYALVAVGDGSYRSDRTQGGITGPVARNVINGGITFRYFDKAHDEISTLAQIRAIMITISTLYDGQTLTLGTSAAISGGSNVSISRL